MALHLPMPMLPSAPTPPPPSSHTFTQISDCKLTPAPQLLCSCTLEAECGGGKTQDYSGWFVMKLSGRNFYTCCLYSISISWTNSNKVFPSISWPKVAKVLHGTKASGASIFCPFNDQQQCLTACLLHVCMCSPLDFQWSPSTSLFTFVFLIGIGN